MAEVIKASDFRKGVTIEFEGKVYVIVDFQHVKPGKGAAFVRTKMKNIIDGGLVERAFNPDEKTDRAYIERKDMEYLYSDGELFHFMDTETYEQIALSKDQLDDALRFVRENEKVKVMSYQGKVFGVEPPQFVNLEITYTEPGAKGNTATNVLKEATVETGAVVQVPLFIEIGDKIQIDTSTGEYLGRAKA